jgi:hypothetical protein
MWVLVSWSSRGAEHIDGRPEQQCSTTPEYDVFRSMATCKNRAWQAAQSLLICKQGVVGSSPIISTPT